MGLSFWQILLVVVIFMLLFGRGKIPALMSDIAVGIKGFKNEMSDEDNTDKPQISQDDSPGVIAAQKDVDREQA